MNSILTYSKRSIFIIALISFGSRIYSQPCVPLPGSSCLPKMWKDKYAGLDMIRDFRLKKLPDIENRASVAQFARIELGNCLDMIKYFEKSFTNYKTLRVYIGEYSNAAIPNVPARFTKQLTLIFAPADSAGKDLNPQIYFVIPPGTNFNENNLSVFQIDKNTKEAWINNYSSVMTLNGINMANPKNVCSTCTIITPTDTWSVLYPRNFLDDLITELGFCHRDATNTRDIILNTSLVAFFAVQDYWPKSQPNYRTIILFEFADVNFNPIYLDDMYNFRKRLQCVEAEGLDNGQLCPTYCQ